MPTCGCGESTKGHAFKSVPPLFFLRAKKGLVRHAQGHRCAHTHTHTQASTDDLVIGVSYILGYGRCGEMEMDNIKYNERVQFS